MDDAVHEYPVHSNGDWTIRNDDVPQLVVRPYGKEGNARHHVPLGNVRTIMVVGMAERRAERDGSSSTPPDDVEAIEVEDWWLCAFHQDVPDYYCCQRERMPECVPVRTFFNRGEYRRAANDAAPIDGRPFAGFDTVWPTSTGSDA